MTAVRRWWARLVGTLRPGERERDLDAELESHLQLHVDDCLRRGMTLEEAKREARLRLGGVAQTKECVRDQSRLRWLESVLGDLRFGARLLRKNPGFAAVAILTLALGIGANTAVFSVVDAVLLDPLPYARPGELAFVSEGAAIAGGEATTTSYATFVDWRERVKGFAELSVLRDWTPTLMGAGDAEELVGARVSSSFFHMLGVRPVLGRDFRPEEDSPATRKVAILSDGFWRRAFGADRAIVGKEILLDSGKFTVIGVLPASFRSIVPDASLPEPADIFAPLGYHASLPYACRTCRHLHVIGRLAPGVSAGAARAELHAVTAALWKEHPDDYGNADVAVVPLADQLLGPVRPMLLVLLGAVGFVLLIACVNLAHLLLARATRREREVAVRTALGASRGRVLRQLLCESCLLAVLGAAAGLVPAAWVPQLLATFGPRTVPRLADVHLDRTVLLFTLGLAVATGVLSGLAPALRVTGRNLHDALRDGARASAGASMRRLRSLLVVAEIALSLTLLVGAGLMLRSVGRILQVHPGFEPERVLTMRLSLVGPRYKEDAPARRTFDDVLARLKELPGVEAAGMTSQIPLGGNFDGYGLHPEGRMNANPELDPGAQRFAVSPDYPRAMGIPLLRGRGFDAADTSATPQVMLVSQSTAERVWPGEDPIGKRAKLGGLERDWWTVVGVVGDIRHVRLDDPPPLAVYVPRAQWEGDSQMILTVRTVGPPLDLAPTVERTVRRAAAQQPVSRVASLAQILAESVAGRRLALAMLALFAAVALVLSTIGI